MYVLYYASMLWRWLLVSILVRTNLPCLGVGFHSFALRPSWHRVSYYTWRSPPSSSFLSPHGSRRFQGDLSPIVTDRFYPLSQIQPKIIELRIKLEKKSDQSLSAARR
jgi:hypothetical protein